MSSSDVETFHGKIICNIDGNACILDSENETFSKLTFATTSPNGGKHFTENCGESEVTRGNLRGDNPKIHTFKVVAAQNVVSGNKSNFNQFNTEKPILMCFICKLSFGNTKSFITHANNDHNLNFQETEQILLKNEFSSAIIQRNMDEKPQISFLEPIAEQMESPKQVIEVPTSTSSTDLQNANVKSFNDNCDTAGAEEQQATGFSDSQNINKLELNENASENTTTNAEQPNVTVNIKLSSQDKSDIKTPTKEAIETEEKCTDNLSSFKFAMKDINNTIDASSALHSILFGSMQHKHLMAENSGKESRLEHDQNQQEFLRHHLNADAETRLRQINSLNASLTAFTNDQQYNGSVKMISDFLQHQLQSVTHQQSNMHLSLPPSCSEHGDTKGIDCKNCEQIEAHYQMNSAQTPIRSPNSLHAANLSISPISASSIPNVASNTAPCFTIGACSEHINGRPIGVDCARCEMILNSARLSNGSQLSTRNSCKTLKCPQCNWHYKYQETLEIHMREKHPDGESACGYCLAGQQHPRLARGESYSCGYKPYRCEICNYSTTTKGNLSIHMQSDKHLNNMQELNSTQNIVAAAVAAGSNNETGQNKIILSNNSNVTLQTSQQQVPPGCSTPSSNSASLNSSSTNSVAAINTTSNKTKPNFRCDICSYETTVARNLRIHMTSEKHTHNMTILQSNIKQIQALNLIQQQQQQQQRAISTGSSIANLPQFGNTSLPMNNFLPEVAIADLAYNQALMIQMLHQNAAAASAAISNSSQSNSSGCSETKIVQSNTSPLPSSLQNEFANQHQLLESHIDGNFASNNNQTQSQSVSNEILDFLPVKPDPWPTTIYSCQVCSVFKTNSLDELNQHILIDRSRCSNGSNNDIMLIQNNNYICRLCNYKTNLKANFQLHSKTDKHLQKLNYINHIREGGPTNEYKLKFLQHQQVSSNMVHLKCNCCDFLTNSIQKLTLHSQNMRHETMRMIFLQLIYIIRQHKRTQSDDNGINSKNLAEDIAISDRLLECQLCNFTCGNLHDMVQHVKSVRHLQVEQFVCLQRCSENLQPLSIEDVFKLSEPLTNGNDIPAQDTKTDCDITTEETESNSDACLALDSKDEDPDARKPLFTESDRLFVIYKCMHCEYFAQVKGEIEIHLNSVHPLNGSEDYITIPTNAAAIQAFQAAMAAVTLSAVKGKAPISEPNDFSKTEEVPSVPIKIEHEENVDMKSTEEDLETIEPEDTTEEQSAKRIQCPLCHDFYTDKDALEEHLICTHTVNREGLSRLLQLVDKSAWAATSTSTSNTSERKTDAEDLNDSTSKAGPHEFTCQICDSSFKYVEQLLQHAQNTQHYALNNGEYLCLSASNTNNSCSMTFGILNNMLSHYKDVHMSVVISERHVYKYRCKQCSLAFKTQEKLTAHSLYHTMRDATKCGQCQRSFRTSQAMQKHMEQAHNIIPDPPPPETVNEKENKFLLNGLSFAECSDSEDNKRMTHSTTQVNEGERQKVANVPSRSTDSLSDVCPVEKCELLPAEQENNHIQLPKPVQNTQQDDINSFQNILPHPLQNLQSLHQMQAQLPQMAAAAAAAGITLNPVDMLNLMQFHHLLSLNFMNLAPPLVFQGNSQTNETRASNPISYPDSGNTEHSICSTATTPNIDCNNSQPAAQQEQSPNSAQFSNNQKRARTRITDDQLKILRAHFDINNSPSEESIMEMSQKANLPMKVVKHWFRNTLFKERQRNKDSPYNFNNPPSTTLNLEEYERTGQAKVTPLSETTNSIVTASESAINAVLAQHQSHDSEHDSEKNAAGTNTPHTSCLSPGNIKMKAEPTEEITEHSFENLHENSKLISKATMMASFIKQHLVEQSSQDMRCHSPSIIQNQSIQSQIQQNNFINYETKSESGSSDVLSRPQSPTSTSTHSMYSGMNDMMVQQMESLPLMSNSNNMGPPKKFQVTKSFDKNSPSSQFDTNSNSSNSSSSSGKRANRTRFTDYQIKVLQEFFENNSYPKDSDLEYLSKLLLLSPRVIVVWFQNARQKQRKIYENQPNNTIFESEEKKQNINYTCKKCSLVFQRYYELIRHHKNHCFKEENNKKSEKAQIAAAQIAQNFSSEDSNSSLEVHNNLNTNSLLGVLKPGSIGVIPTPTLIATTSQSIASSSPQHNSTKSLSPSTTPTPPRSSSSFLEKSQAQKHTCVDCKESFATADQLKSHELIHVMDKTLNSQNETTAIGSFGSLLQSLQQAAAFHQHQHQHQQFNELSSPTSKKRKLNDSYLHEELFPFTGVPATFDEAMAKKHEILIQYFMQTETSSDLKQKFLIQRQCSPDSEAEIEFLTNYYHQSESKKISNYDYLYQYFVKNEELANQSENRLQKFANEKPSLEYLSRYYQLNESKKFFPLEASLHPSPDGQNQPKAKIHQKHLAEPPTRQRTFNSNLDKKPNEKYPLQDENESTQYSVNNGKEETNPNTQSPQDKPQSMVKDTEDEKSTHFYTQNASNNYFNNLEDFLDATMIENDNQTLSFNSDIKESNAIGQSPPNNLKSNNEKQNKRLRTTILPEQLNFLYECYQNESNPSRKMLEDIAKKVNLKKRVVQVWFQNSRAKDKKSRNQRQFSGISDDNSSHDDVTRDVSHTLSFKTSLKANIDSDSSNAISGENLRDCEICQVYQVNIQQHSISIEHIRNVKALLQQTGVSSEQSKSLSENTSGSEDLEFEDSLKNSQYASNIHKHDDLNSRNEKVIPTTFDTREPLRGKKEIEPILLQRQQDNIDCSEKGNVSRQQLELTESVKDNVSNKSHLSDIIRKFFNFNQITDK